MADPGLWDLDDHTRAKHRVLRAYLDAWIPVMAHQALKVRASVGAYAYDYAYYASSSGRGAVADRPAGSKPDDRASSGRR